MDLSIVIVNWNSVAYVRKCLETLFAQTRDIAFEVIVVDSASYDGCGEMLAKDFPAVRFIQSPQNIGFARSNNLGARDALGRQILFLNPDTEVIGPSINTLSRALLSLPGAGAAGAKLLNSDGSLQTSCIQTFPTLLNQALDNEFIRSRTPNSRLWGMAPLFANKVASVDVLSGACILIRSEIFRKIGGFPEEYFMYSEDLELCYRVREAGFQNYYVPEAVIKHHGGGSSQQSRSEFSSVMMRESVCRFLSRTRGPVYAATYRFMISVSAVVRLGCLVLLWPIKAIRGQAKPTYGAARKWLAIFKWSLGLQSWLAVYR